MVRWELSLCRHNYWAKIDLDHWWGVAGPIFGSQNTWGRDFPCQCWKVCINNDILPSICVVNPVLFGQKAARIRGCLCFQTVTREEQTGPGLRDIFMVPGGAGRERVGRWAQWEDGRMVTRTPMDINEDTDISIRCDLSFILISVIRLNFYNFSFSSLIWF